MDEALVLAHRAGAAGEVPVGAIVVDADGMIIARAQNAMRQLHDPTAHAEISALRQAATYLGNERLLGCALYVTLEPCAMCAGAIALARIAHLYYGASDPKSGACAHGRCFFDAPHCHHRPEVYDGIKKNDASHLLKSFFIDKRAFF